MADSEEVLKELSARGCEIIGIVVNEKGAERACDFSVQTLVSLFVSPTFLGRNQKQTLKRLGRARRGFKGRRLTRLDTGCTFRCVWNRTVILGALTR